MIQLEEKEENETEEEKAYATKSKRISGCLYSRRKGGKIKLIPRNTDNDNTDNSWLKSIQVHGIIQMTLNRQWNGCNT